ncbi:MAG: 50S ribosomal protein L9 [Gemmatimonadales bacterium]|jgi:large subunit ribosomal protein L9|nr:MAG: 50S ribosomal protein L9 [Gemmatimonadales bacterium]
MKVILKESMPNLGEPGTVVDVKPGYARNYLLPQGLAYEASQANIERLEAEQRARAEAAKRDYLEAKRRAAQLNNQALTFQAKAGEEGKLFGSVTGADVAERLNAEGGLDFELEKRSVVLPDPIKELGDYQVEIKLHSDVSVHVAVSVSREGA